MCKLYLRCIFQYRIRYDELLQRTLWLAVWNNDRFGHNDFLGEVVLSIDEYQSSGFNLEDPDPMWRNLCERVRVRLISRKNRLGGN